MRSCLAWCAPSNDAASRWRATSSGSCLRRRRRCKCRRHLQQALPRARHRHPHVPRGWHACRPPLERCSPTSCTVRAPARPQEVSRADGHAARPPDVAISHRQALFLTSPPPPADWLKRNVSEAADSGRDVLRLGRHGHGVDDTGTADAPRVAAETARAIYHCMVRPATVHGRQCEDETTRAALEDAAALLSLPAYTRFALLLQRTAQRSLVAQLQGPGAWMARRGDFQGFLCTG